MAKKAVTIYTDGACDPNPGIGGWAAILLFGEARKEITGGERESTNNRMEMTAVIEALKLLNEPCAVTLITDSEYVKNAFTQGWLQNWLKRGWKTADKKPVKNKDLWEELVKQTDLHQVEWKWVKGHANDELNNRCDELAVMARQKLARGG
ncbi:ribonuclease HI [bacterium]|nr:MAG: ribonuclease HI [bacterium]